MRVTYCNLTHNLGNGPLKFPQVYNSHLAFLMPVSPTVNSNALLERKHPKGRSWKAGKSLIRVLIPFSSNNSDINWTGVLEYYHCKDGQGAARASRGSHFRREIGTQATMVHSGLQEGLKLPVHRGSKCDLRLGAGSGKKGRVKEYFRDTDMWDRSRPADSWWGGKGEGALCFKAADAQGKALCCFTESTLGPMKGGKRRGWGGVKGHFHSMPQYYKFGMLVPTSK